MATTMGGTASIPLIMMVLMEALLLLAAAGTSVAAVSGDTTIHLPSDARGADNLVRAMARANKQGDKDNKRPWECCDSLLCSRSLPMFCRCFDQVERCSDACEECEQTGSRYMCNDRYEWFPGDDPMPRCHEHGNARGGFADPGKTAAAAVMANDRKKARGGDEKQQRPWKCCDVPICTRSWPPVCHCADTVARCASTCERCEQVEEGSTSGGGGPRYRCLDQHQGDPGPSCRKEAGRGDRDDWARRLARGLHRFSSYA